jgi:hypothetical protein
MYLPYSGIDRVLVRPRVGVLGALDQVDLARV